jgi:hypothetical protein
MSGPRRFGKGATVRTSELLHYAFRARDPLALADWYADLFDGQFFIHPVLCGLGIALVKINHPEAVFHGLLEFWPCDVVWDGPAAVFRKIEARPSPTSYGHMAVKVSLDTEGIGAELRRRGIAFRLEPRAPGFLIPVIDDPEGNMIELFPNVAHIELPPQAFCPRENAPQVFAALRAQLGQKMAGRKAEDGVPLQLFDG